MVLEDDGVAELLAEPIAPEEPEPDEEPIAPDDEGAGAAEGEVLEGEVLSVLEGVLDGVVPEGLLMLEELLAVEGSVLSALWQAVNVRAAKTGTSRVVYFMSFPFEGSGCSQETVKGIRAWLCYRSILVLTLIPLCRT
jgi:hypothetical protein